tara:strand:- start:1410 stop:2822 length:1413 start_codon:yes stop_codon:yes gene_type:complete
MSAVTQSSTGEGSIPNLISLQQIPCNFAQSLETDLLEPVIFNQGSATTDGFVRFTLQNKGFLHSHSKLFMSVENDAAASEGFLNPVTGIGQVIKKAVLKIGNKTLNEVSSWDALHGVKSSLIKSENNVEREFYTTSRVMNSEFVYDEDSSVKASQHGLDNGWEYTKTSATQTPASVDGLRIPTFAVSNVNKGAESPTFAVDLSDLFPFLKVNQLPLYMINEPINIELTFHPTGQRLQQTTDFEAGVPNGLVRQVDMKFCADYVFYGETDEMERFAAANQDMSFSFVDYRSVEATISDGTLASNVIRNLGMANRMVPRVITTLANTGKGQTNILTKANAQAPALATGVPGAVAYNLRYNDRYEFTTDVENTARLFSILTDSEGVPFLNRTQYSHQKNMITTKTYGGHNQHAELAGEFFYLGTKLTGGRIGQRGLEINLKGAFPASTTLMRNFCEYLRVAKLSGGLFEVYNA